MVVQFPFGPEQLIQCSQLLRNASLCLFLLSVPAEAALRAGAPDNVRKFLFLGPREQRPEKGENQLRLSDRPRGPHGAEGQQHAEADLGPAAALRRGR